MTSIHTQDPTLVQLTRPVFSGGGGGPRHVDHLRTLAPASEQSLHAAEREASIAPLLPLLAPLVEYPTAALVGQILACRAALASTHPEAAEELSAFLEWVINEPVESVEEAFTRTFYLSPVCIPYVSVHIFGDESFQRGALMAKLREGFERLAFDAGPELPDHIAVLLRFSERLASDERRELIEYCLCRPIEKMDEQISRTTNPYRHAVRAIRQVLSPGDAQGA